MVGAVAADRDEEKESGEGRDVVQVGVRSNLLSVVGSHRHCRFHCAPYVMYLQVLVGRVGGEEAEVACSLGGVDVERERVSSALHGMMS